MNEEGSDLHSSGLLSRLHNFYRPGRRSYRKEDLFTEYLAALLNRSGRFRVAFADLALDDSADMSPELFFHAEALTQVDTGGRGWIDLVLEVAALTEGGASKGSPQFKARLGIECKVDLTLGEEQPRRYHEWLEEEAERCRHVALAALTKKRLGQQSPFKEEKPPYWQGRLYWHKVEEELERCVEEVRSDLGAINPEEDEFLGAAGFIVIGDELRALMREEGMVVATKVDPRAIVDRYREYKRYKSRIDGILSLVDQAIETAEIERRLLKEMDADSLRTKHKKPLDKGRPVSILYLRDDPPARFMFGVMVSPPNPYVRRQNEPVRSADGYEAELIAAYKLLDESGGPLQWHHGRQELEDLTQSLTDVFRDRSGLGDEVFVPKLPSYQKFVARVPVPAAESADEQAGEMGRFYWAFMSAFLEAEAPDGRRLLSFLRDRHEHAVAGA